MRWPEYPTPLGVFRAIEAPTYEGSLYAQIEEATERKGAGTLEALLHGTETWVVE